MPKYLSNSENGTKKIAANIAKKAKTNIFALTGELGAGKTTFIQGFAKGLGIKGKIISPTFVIIRQHQIPGTRKTLYHMDLYRLENTQDFKELGIEEILLNPNNIVLIEWAEKYPVLPQSTLRINITKLKASQRLIFTD